MHIFKPEYQIYYTNKIIFIKIIAKQVSYLLFSDAAVIVLRSCRRLLTFDSSMAATFDLQRTLLSEKDSASSLVDQRAARHNRHA